MSAGIASEWGLWAVLLGAGAFGLWAEGTRWGARLSAPVVAIAATFALSNLGLIPATSPVYDRVWQWLVPLAIPLLLLRADLRRIVREAGPLLAAYVAGAAGTVLGALAAHALVPVPEAARLAGVFTATYTGGSMNYVATAEALGLHDAGLLAAGMAADNLLMTVLFVVLFALPGVRALRRRYPDRPGVEGDGGMRGAEAALPGPLPAAATLALAAAACAAGYALEALTGLRGSAVLWLTALAVAFATLAPGAARRLAEAERIGVLLMQVFFAAIGASAHVGTVLRAGPALLAFAGTVLAVHLAVILLAGWLLRLDLREVVVASNANAGGPTTAAAMASAAGWRGLVTPAVLSGTLGYAGGTFLGTAVGRWLEGV